MRIKNEERRREGWKDLEVKVEADLAVYVGLASVGGVEREPTRYVLVVRDRVERNVDTTLHTDNTHHHSTKQVELRRKTKKMARTRKRFLPKEVRCQHEMVTPPWSSDCSFTSLYKRIDFC